MPVYHGTSGADVLAGSAGADTLSGKAGDDNYVVNDINDVVVELAMVGQNTTLVTATAAGAAGTMSSFNPVYSPQGRYVVFESSAYNLAANTSWQDLFIKDLLTGAVERLTTGTDGLGGNRDSHDPVFSPDGRKVLFQSLADNLVAGDTNGIPDYFIKDLDTGSITRVSTFADGSQSGRTAPNINAAVSNYFRPVFTPDGQGIVFASSVNYTGRADHSYDYHLYLKNLANGTVTELDIAVDGKQGNSSSFPVAFSADGSKLVFMSWSGNLGSSNGSHQIYLYDMNTSVLTPISINALGAAANGHCDDAVFSPNGNFLLFSSAADNLVSGKGVVQGYNNLYLKNLLTGEVTLLTTNAAGQALNLSYLSGGRFSPDSATVIFGSKDAGIVAGDTNGAYDLFFKSLETGVITRLTTDSMTQINGDTGGQDLSYQFSPDGSSILVESRGSNLLAEATVNTQIFRIALAGGGGYDRIDASVSYTLPDQVESLILTGSANINGTGNVLDNVLTGNSGANILSGLAGNDRLDGGEGADRLIGGTGNDTYVTDSLSDIVRELAGEGADTLESSISLTLTANVENLTLTGSGHLKGIGNEWDNVLTGNSGHNVLKGYGGQDTLIGGLGNDSYYLDSVDDVVTELAGGGTDYVYAKSSYSLSDNIERLYLLDGYAAALNGAGNAGVNVLTGNAYGNVLRGNGGNDILYGKGGSDTYEFGRGDGKDSITDGDPGLMDTDVLAFLAGINHDQLWFSNVGSDLVVSVIGTTDKVTVKNWATGPANHVEQFRTTEGAENLLLSGNVAALVAAMSGFIPPPLGVTSLSSPAYDPVLTAIAAAWS